MENNLPKCVDRINEKIQAIIDAGGVCPHCPKLFDSNPNPLKKQEVSKAQPDVSPNEQSSSPHNYV